MSNHALDRVVERFRPEVRRTRRLEYVTIAFVVISAALRFAVTGGSSAMMAALLEDCLEVLPAAAILATLYLEERPATRSHPFGNHRIGTLAFFGAALALASVGLWVAFEAAGKLISHEHGEIGNVSIFGATIWQGWMMVIVLLVTGLPALPIASAKKSLGESLHLEALATDAKANVAHIMVSLAAALGVIGVAAGLWWADPLAALLIGLAVTRDGWLEIAASISEMIDQRPEDKTMNRLDSVVRSKPWVRDHHWLARESGRFVEASLYIAVDDATLDQIENWRQELEGDLRDAEWRLHSLTISFGRTIWDQLDEAGHLWVHGDEARSRGLTSRGSKSAGRV